MDFYISKTETHRSFRNTDGQDYRTRSMITLFGSMVQFDYPNQQLREEFPKYLRNSDNQKILVVCAGESEKEFLKEGGSFDKKNIKLKFSVPAESRELEIDGTLFLLKEDFDELKNLIDTLPRPNTYLYGTIVPVGGRLETPNKAYMEGYFEGIKTLSYLHGEQVYSDDEE